MHPGASVKCNAHCDIFCMRQTMIFTAWGESNLSPHLSTPKLTGRGRSREGCRWHRIIAFVESDYAGSARSDD